MTEPADTDKKICNRIEEAKYAKLTVDAGSGRLFLDQALEMAGDSFLRLKPETQVAIIKAKREFGVELTVNEKMASNRLRVPLTSPVMARHVFPEDKIG